MTVTNILALIDAKIATLHDARALIAESGLQKPESHKTVHATVAKPKQKRNLSPEARARIVAGVKARWARQKEAAK